MVKQWGHKASAMELQVERLRREVKSLSHKLEDETRRSAKLGEALTRRVTTRCGHGECIRAYALEFGRVGEAAEDLCIEAENADNLRVFIADAETEDSWR